MDQSLKTTDTNSRRDSHPTNKSHNRQPKTNVTNPVFKANDGDRRHKPKNIYTHQRNAPQIKAHSHPPQTQPKDRHHGSETLPTNHTSKLLDHSSEHMPQSPHFTNHKPKMISTAESHNSGTQPRNTFHKSQIKDDFDCSANIQDPRFTIRTSKMAPQCSFHTSQATNLLPIDNTKQKGIGFHKTK